MSATCMTVERLRGLVLIEAGAEIRVSAVDRIRDGVDASARGVDPALLRPRPKGDDWAQQESAFLWKALARIPCPTRIVRGEKSPVVSVEMAERMAQTLPEGDVVGIPDAGHVVMRDQPEAFRAVLEQFLEAHA